MWQRALIAVLLLSVMAILLVASSNSRVDDTSMADATIPPAVVDTGLSEAQAHQMRQLNEEASHAMRTLIAKRMQAAISVKAEMKDSDRKSRSISPSE